MSVTDLIADQLTVIRNAIMVGKKDVIIKKSGTMEEILRIIKREGFIENYKIIDDNRQGKVKIYLKYMDDGTPVMEKLVRVSKPGRRQYVPSKDIKNVIGGVGVAIISTSKGVLTDKEAKEQGVGGELLCKIW